MIKQVGGTHYQRLQYQTWDFVADFNLDFFTANAIKYLSRYQYKNCDEDLRKARSYVAKIKERSICAVEIDMTNDLVLKYLNQFNGITRLLIVLVIMRKYDEVLNILESEINVSVTKKYWFKKHIDIVIICCVFLFWLLVVCPRIHS